MEQVGVRLPVGPPNEIKPLSDVYRRGGWGGGEKGLIFICPLVDDAI